MKSGEHMVLYHDIGQKIKDIIYVGSSKSEAFDALLAFIHSLKTDDKIGNFICAAYRPFPKVTKISDTLPEFSKRDIEEINRGRRESTKHHIAFDRPYQSRRGEPHD